MQATTSSLLLAAVLALPCGVASAQAADENTFYRAFYLDRGERRYEAAADLYQRFLDAHGDHRLAPQAARNLVQLLHRIERSEEANAVAERFAPLLRAAASQEGRTEPPVPPAGRGPVRPGGEPGEGRGRPGGAGQRMDPEAREARLQEMTSALDAARKELAAAREAGDEDRAADLQRRVQRLERTLEMARRGPGEGGVRGAGAGRGLGLLPPRPFAELSADERAEWVETAGERISVMAERLRGAGREEQADGLEAALKRVLGLVEAGRFEEAEKAAREVGGGFQRRGPGRGQQEGREGPRPERVRRGGEGSGAEGEAPPIRRGPRPGGGGEGR